MNKSFRILALSSILAIVMNVAFMANITIPVELYFIIMYSINIVAIVFLISGLCNNIIDNKIWDKKDYKNSLFDWGGGVFFLIILVFILKSFFIPMTMDLPRVVTGRYEEINGSVKYIKSNYGSTRKWFEPIQYVHFKEETSGEIIKITFHVSKTKVGYAAKKLYYLPNTKWGIKAEL